MEFSFERFCVIAVEAARLYDRFPEFDSDIETGLKAEGRSYAFTGEDKLDYLEQTDFLMFLEDAMRKEKGFSPDFAFPEAITEARTAGDLYDCICSLRVIAA